MNYEEMVSAGIAARETKDAAQWKLGDLANLLPDDTLLKTFADAVNVSPSSMSDYHQLSAFYSQSARADFPNLSYSHFRRAWRVHKDDPAAALELLERASSQGWTVRWMDHELAKGKPEPQKIKASELLAKFGNVELVMTEFETKIKFELSKPKVSEELSLPSMFRKA